MGEPRYLPPIADTARGLDTGEALAVARRLHGPREGRTVADALEALYAEDIGFGTSPSDERRVRGMARKRLAALTWDELDLFLDGMHPDRNLLMWVALCRRHAFLADLSRELLRDAWLLGDRLDHAAYDRWYWWSVGRWDAEHTTPNPRLRAGIMRMLRELDALQPDGHVLALLPSRRLTARLEHTGEAAMLPL